MNHLTPIVIPTPFDAHLHLRDGGFLDTTVAHSSRLWGGAIVMPNLKPAVRTVAQALDYRERILARVGNPGSFNPCMTLYLTEETSDDDLHEVVASYGKVVACKLYPAGATTNSSEGIPDVEKAFRIFETMERLDVPLCVHGEVTDPAVDVFDREKAFVERYLDKIVKTFPNLRIVLEHVTTCEGVDFVEAVHDRVAASITAHHLLFNRNAIFQSGVRPHFYCLPVLKRDVHQSALIRAAIGGSGKFFAGTDSAPHAKHLKEASCGCAGCYTAPQGLEAYALAFEKMGAFDAGQSSVGVATFADFVSRSAPKFYGIAAPQGTVTLSVEEEGIPVPETYAYGEHSLVPLFAGETMRWKAERPS